MKTADQPTSSEMDPCSAIRSLIALGFLHGDEDIIVASQASRAGRDVPMQVCIRGRSRRYLVVVNATIRSLSDLNALGTALVEGGLKYHTHDVAYLTPDELRQDEMFKGQFPRSWESGSALGIMHLGTRFGDSRLFDLDERSATYSHNENRYLTWREVV